MCMRYQILNIENSCGGKVLRAIVRQKNLALCMIHQYFVMKSVFHWCTKWSNNTNGVLDSEYIRGIVAKCPGSCRIVPESRKA